LLLYNWCVILADFYTLVDFLRFKAQQTSSAQAETPSRLIHLRGLLSGYDTSPEALAKLRRELWAEATP
jgi:hypothetical protein